MKVTGYRTLRTTHRWGRPVGDVNGHIASGVTDRAGLIDYVANYSGEGLARTYEWDDTGELAAALIWIYEVQ